MKEKLIKFTKTLAIIVLIFTILISGFLLYVSDYYRADTPAIEEFIVDRAVNKTILYDGVIKYETTSSNLGFIFYPGGKVEYTSYEPLMYELASKGITCLLLEMPYNLAVLNMNAASKVFDLCPEVDQWYIGGHSLGGTIAATYLEKNINKISGLVLLGSYSTSNLSNTNINVLSIYGSEDKVMNRDNYEKYKVNLPSDFAEIIIDGGCHAYFGMYGMQDKDGIPNITVEEQIIITADYIVDFINN